MPPPPPVEKELTDLSKSGGCRGKHKYLAQLCSGRLRYYMSAIDDGLYHTRRLPFGGFGPFSAIYIHIFHKTEIKDSHYEVLNRSVSQLVQKL